MKINDKHLCAFASGSAPVDKQGHLLKKGEVNKSFQRRWFILKGNLLFYFEKAEDRAPLGVIVLQDCTVEVSSECEESYAFELGFDGSGARTYVMAAASQEEMEDWMKALTCANYDYMKLMVADLQQQLVDLQSTSRASTTASTTSERQTLMVACAAQTSALIDLESPNVCEGASMELMEFPGSKAWGNHSSRCFEEMHRDFGESIKQKTHESIYRANP